MTIKELIKELQKLDGKNEVVVEVDNDGMTFEEKIIFIYNNDDKAIIVV